MLALVQAGCDSSGSGLTKPEERNPHFQKGRKLQEQRDYQAAADAFRKAVRVNPDFAKAHLELGMLYEDKLSDPVAAIYHYRRYLELEPNSNVSALVRDYIERARLSLASGLPQSPVGDLNEIAQLQRDNALLSQENSRLKTQVASLEEALAARPQVVSRPTPTPTPTPPPAPTHPPTPEPPPRVTIPPPPQPPPTVVVTQPPPTHTTPPPVENPRVRTHIVQKGDTLQSLALHYYGTRSQWEKIYLANRNTMPTKNDLKIGQRLIIP